MTLAGIGACSHGAVRTSKAWSTHARAVVANAVVLATTHAATARAVKTRRGRVALALLRNVVAGAVDAARAHRCGAVLATEAALGIALARAQASGLVALTLERAIVLATTDAAVIATPSVRAEALTVGAEAAAGAVILAKRRLGAILATPVEVTKACAVHALAVATALGVRAEKGLAVGGRVPTVHTRATVLARKALVALALAVGTAGAVARAVARWAGDEVAAFAGVALLAVAHAGDVALAVAGTRKAIGSRAVSGLAPSAVVAVLALTTVVYALAVLVAVVRAVGVLTLLTNIAGVTDAHAVLAFAVGTASLVGALGVTVRGRGAADATPAFVATTDAADTFAIARAVLVLAAVIGSGRTGAVLAGEALHALAQATHTNATGHAGRGRAILFVRAIVERLVAGWAAPTRKAVAGAVAIFSIAVALVGAALAAPAELALTHVTTELVMDTFAVGIALRWAAVALAVFAGVAGIAFARAIVAHTVPEAVARALAEAAVNTSPAVHALALAVSLASATATAAVDTDRL